MDSLSTKYSTLLSHLGGTATVCRVNGSLLLAVSVPALEKEIFRQVMGAVYHAAQLDSITHIIITVK